MSAQFRIPRWYTIPVRVVLITFICTLLSFAVCLLIAIVGVVALSAHRHVNPDMRLAYRHIALPVALLVGNVAFLFSLVMEIRYYRRSRTLAAIARLTEEQQLGSHG